MDLDRIAITGGRGQLGYELSRRLGSQAISFDRHSLDITNREVVLDRLLSLRPSAIINAAAFTKVDLAESESDRCHLVNAIAISYLADVCRNLDCPLVQVSTDYVFGGDADRRSPYAEEEIPSPINVYGRSKLQGELFAATHGKHFIIRTSGLYGGLPPASPPRNFVDNIIALGGERPVLRVVDDQHFTPSYVPHVAQAILLLLTTSAYGTYHVVNEGAATWCNFAKEISDLSRLRVRVEPIPSSAWIAPARRPSYSVLGTNKYRLLFGPLPDWHDALAEYLREHHGKPGASSDATESS